MAHEQYISESSVEETAAILHPDSTHALTRFILEDSDAISSTRNIIPVRFICQLMKDRGEHFSLEETLEIDPEDAVFLETTTAIGAARTGRYSIPNFQKSDSIWLAMKTAERLIDVSEDLSETEDVSGSQPVTSLKTMLSWSEEHLRFVYPTPTKKNTPVCRNGVESSSFIHIGSAIIEGILISQTLPSRNIPERELLKTGIFIALISRTRKRHDRNSLPHIVRTMCAFNMWQDFDPASYRTAFLPSDLDHFQDRTEQIRSQTELLDSLHDADPDLIEALLTFHDNQTSINYLELLFLYLGIPVTPDIIDDLRERLEVADPESRPLRDILERLYYIPQRLSVVEFAAQLGTDKYRLGLKLGRIQEAVILKDPDLLHPQDETGDRTQAVPKESMYWERKLLVDASVESLDAHIPDPPLFPDCIVLVERRRILLEFSQLLGELIEMEADLPGSPSYIFAYDELERRELTAMKARYRAAIGADWESTLAIRQQFPMVISGFESRVLKKMLDILTVSPATDGNSFGQMWEERWRYIYLLEHPLIWQEFVRQIAISFQNTDLKSLAADTKSQTFGDGEYYLPAHAHLVNFRRLLVHEAVFSGIPNASMRADFSNISGIPTSQLNSSPRVSNHSAYLKRLQRTHKLIRPILIRNGAQTRQAKEILDLSCRIVPKLERMYLLESLLLGLAGGYSAQHISAVIYPEQLLEIVTKKVRVARRSSDPGTAYRNYSTSDTYTAYIQAGRRILLHALVTARL